MIPIGIIFYIVSLVYSIYLCYIQVKLYPKTIKPLGLYNINTNVNIDFKVILKI